MRYDEKHLLKENKLIKHLKYPKELILKYSNRFDWTFISATSKLSDQDIEVFKDYIDWENIACYQNLSESFIEKYIDKLGFNYISAFQMLSENFIERHKNKVYWQFISSYQNISDTFIINNFNRIYKFIKCLKYNEYFNNRIHSEELIIFLKLKGIDISDL